MKKPFSLLDSATQKLIRKAWAAGKRKVTLDGRVFLLSRQTVPANYVTTTTPAVNQDERVTKRVQRKEHWLVVKPERGDRPSANIELKYMDNLRSSVNGQ